MDYFAEAVAITKAHRDALTFSPRPILTLPHDPLADAVRAIDSARADFEFAVIEAHEARDAEGLRQIRTHLAACLEGLRVVELMAQDFAHRTFKE
jgi:hypothetical protein